MEERADDVNNEDVVVQSIIKSTYALFVKMSAAMYIGNVLGVVEYVWFNVTAGFAAAKFWEKHSGAP